MGNRKRPKPPSGPPPHRMADEYWDQDRLREAFRLMDDRKHASNAKRAVIRRLAEPSTYAGLAGFAVFLGIQSQEWVQWSQFAMLVFSAMAILMRETGSPDEKD